MWTRYFYNGFMSNFFSHVMFICNFCSSQAYIRPNNTNMGIWETFKCHQHMACHESYGIVSISTFHGLAFKQAFMASNTRCYLASLVYYLPSCFCSISSAGGLPAQFTSCIYYYHTSWAGTFVMNDRALK